jgi:hypothetical protein
MARMHSALEDNDEDDDEEDDDEDEADVALMLRRLFPS